MIHPFMRLFQTWLLLAVGVLASAHLVPGISYDNAASLIIVVILLSFLNAFLKPLLLIFTLPFIVLTMGLGVLLINAFLFYLAGYLVDGFQVDSFGSAFFGGLIVSIISLFINSLFKNPKRKGSSFRKIEQQNDDDDVIDI